MPPKPTRALVHAATAWPVRRVTPAIRALLALECDGVPAPAVTVPGPLRHGGVLRRSASEPDEITLTLDSAGTVTPADLLELVPVASNLGQGSIWLWRCGGCGGLARYLYAASWRWQCRCCAQLVYRSSRESDRRVSALLRDPVAYAAELAARRQRRKDAGPADNGPPSALELARRIQALDDGLIVLLKAWQRLDSTHSGQGRPWSAARRAAAGRRSGDGE